MCRTPGIMSEGPPIIAVTAMDEDQSVIKSIMEGGVDEFEVLLRKYSPKVFVMVGHKVPPVDVEMVVQDVFLSAFRSLGTYEAVQPFEHWLARITRRRCCDYWRDRERRERVESGSLDGSDRSGLEHALMALAAGSDQQDAVKQDVVDQVHRAVLSLGAEDRALIEGIYFEEVPLKEMAVTLGWSLVKTKVRAYRARNKLRMILQSMQVDGGAG